MNKMTIMGGLSGSALLFMGFMEFVTTKFWNLPSIILVFSGAVLIAVFVVLNFGKIKALAAKRSLLSFGNALAASILVFGIIAMLNYVLDKRNLRFDLTQSKQYSLSEQTKTILRNLTHEVRITAFEDSNNRFFFDHIFTEYMELSDFITYDFVDPNQQPRIARNYGVQTYGDVVLECGNKTQIINGNDEHTLTNALIKVTRGEQKNVYFLTGHGEGDIDDIERTGYSKLKELVEEQNYTVKNLDLGRDQSVPIDCSVLVIIGPTSPLFPAELSAINAFINAGGKVLFMLDPDPSPGMNDFFDAWGVVIGDDMVVDNSGIGRLYGMGVEVPAVSFYGKHLIVKDFARQNTFFPGARSILPKKGGIPPLVEIEPLVITSANSWGEVDIPDRSPETSGAAIEVRYDEGRDLKGPATLGVVVTKRIKEGAPESTEDLNRGAMVVFGDSDFARNIFHGNRPNVNLLMNSINWLAEEEDLVSIPPKIPEDRRITMTAKQAEYVLYFTVLVIPGLILLTGMSVFYRRKNL
ncbi:GldG family protein [candidate division KSB1 bacterium]